MDVCFIGCMYRDDIYSHNCSGLVEWLRREGNLDIKLITSNCNCFSSSQRYSIASEELLNNNCEAIKIPYAPPEPSIKYGKIKYYIVRIFKLNLIFEMMRGVAFFNKIRGCRIVHFDQVLKSFGFISFMTLLTLSKLFGKKVVVTVHELDPLQERYRQLNKIYNRTDKIIVFARESKDQLVKLGVNENLIEVIPYGVSIEPIKKFERRQFIYFGGHKLLKGKGFNTVLKALKILESKAKDIKLVIYVGEGCIGLEDGKRMVSEMGFDGKIEWSEFLYGQKLSEAYQRSIGCLIPYTGGSGRYPATTAMANATPVIATRKASLPEYLDELGLYVNEDSADELAAAIIYLMDNPNAVSSVGEKLRQMANERFSMEVVARKTLNVYNDILR